jgi:hypothetical protein
MLEIRGLGACPARSLDEIADDIPADTKAHGGYPRDDSAIVMFRWLGAAD